MSSYLSGFELLLETSDDAESNHHPRGVLGTESRGAPETGPLLLMRAVLRDAILCLQGQAPDVPAKLRPRAAVEARRWVQSRRAGYAFSFESICDVLGLDAQALRARLLRTLEWGESAATDTHRRALVRDLRRSRMRGNTKTKVVARRERRGVRKAAAGARPAHGFEGAEEDLVEAAGGR